MRKLETYQRREELLALLYDNPMPTREAAEALDIDKIEIRNDIGHMKRMGFIVKHSQHPRPGRVEGYHMVDVWRATQKLTAKQMEAMTYARKTVYEERPELPDNLLLMMGYAIHKPENARFVNNEHLNVNVPLRKMHISIGNHWGIMMEASQ